MDKNTIGHRRTVDRNKMMRAEASALTDFPGDRRCVYNPHRTAVHSFEDARMTLHSLGFVALLVLAQEPVADDEAKAWQQRRLAEFAAYDVAEIQNHGEIAVRFESASLLNWTNPIRNSPAGAVFLWTVDGRPRMIASTYPFEAGIEQELQSLSERPLILRQDGGPVHRFPPGIEWKTVPDAEPPVVSRTLRLTQMRRIAERFRVTGNKGRDNPFDVRLLTKPIYRSATDAKADVAVFAFVQGTDPEAVLLIEAVGDKSWRYAFARMTVVPITAALDGKDVWTLPECWSTRYLADHPFHTVQLRGAR
jgi:hypothetical protein